MTIQSSSADISRCLCGTGSGKKEHDPANFLSIFVRRLWRASATPLHDGTQTQSK
jgi:hypothetical protein